MEKCVKYSSTLFEINQIFKPRPPPYFKNSKGNGSPK